MRCAIFHFETSASTASRRLFSVAAAFAAEGALVVLVSVLLLVVVGVGVRSPAYDARRAAGDPVGGRQSLSGIDGLGTVRGDKGQVGVRAFLDAQPIGQVVRDSDDVCACRAASRECAGHRHVAKRRNVFIRVNRDSLTSRHRACRHIEERQAYLETRHI
jgi:hypothetical protein